MGGFAHNFTAGWNAAADPKAFREQQQAKEQDALKLQTAPLTQAIQADRQKLTAFMDDKGNVIPEHQKDYDATVKNMGDMIGRLRGVLGQRAPGEDPNHFESTVASLTDKLHITRDLAHRLAQRQSGKVNDYYAQNQQIAKDEAAGAAPPEPGALTADEQHQANRVKGGLDPKAGASVWTRNGSPVQVGDKWMQPEMNKEGENRMVPMPEGWKPPVKTSTSQFATERNDYANVIGKPPSEWTPEDTGKFYEWKFQKLQPLARVKLGLEQQKIQIAQASLGLRQNQNDWKETQDITKMLAPVEQIKAVANATDDYISNPTGPGDAALTMAFFEVAKQMDAFGKSGGANGIRFTAQEQKLIQGARGWADAAKANVERWGKGTLYDDNQRKQMGDIVKIARNNADKHEQNIVNSMGKLNPKATGAAAGAAGVDAATVPEGPKTKELKSSKKLTAKDLEDALQ